jgi:hypothetical protein
MPLVFVEIRLPVLQQPIPVAAPYVRGRSLAGIVGLNPAGGMDVRLVIVLCVCATGP